MTGAPPPLRSLRGTALGRMIDLRYASNRTAVAGAAVAGAATLLVGAVAGDGASLPDAIRVGIGTFLAWALTRELSPDHVTAAAIAMVPAAFLALVSIPAVAAMVIALLATRVWAGTVGNHPSIVDLVGAVTVAAYAGSDPELWIPAACLAAGLVRHSPHRAAAAGTAAAMVAASAVVAVLTESARRPEVSPVDVAVVAAAAAVLAWLLPIRTVRSLTDWRSQPISPARVGTGWLAGLATVIGVALFDEVAAAGPLLAAGAAGAVALSIDRLRPSRGD